MLCPDGCPIDPGHLFKFYSSTAAFILQAPLYLIFISLMISINNNDGNGSGIDLKVSVGDNK